MFSAEDIDTRLHERPFQPFRIVMSSGANFDVAHPELVLIGRRTLFVGAPSSENPRHFEQASRLAIAHITAFEDLPTSSRPPGGNGAE
ncbi:MAG: hypothetical protein RIC55_18215 [Pirellulaceae bacterium]